MSRKKMVIVGAGISGLTAAAYLARSGHQVTVLEKTSRCGGLVGSFRKDGVLFDTGPRAFGNAGILIPMLEDLGIRLPLVKGLVSTGIGKETVHHDGRGSVRDYTGSLERLFPESVRDIRMIEKKIRFYSRIAGTLNRLPNPFFKNPLKDFRYLFGKFLPWFPFFLEALLKTGIGKKTAEELLDRLTGNASLKDMVCQHFFKGTPAAFAFGYFESFLDYQYPLGGTGELPRVLEEKILAGGGTILKEREAARILPAEKKIHDRNGAVYPYDSLLWAADLRSLYSVTETSFLKPAVVRSIDGEKRKFLAARPGESAFTLFVGVDEPPEYFGNISRGHFIYTPETGGLGQIHRSRLDEMKKNFPGISREEWFRWLKDFCAKNSYEISVPALKDPSLAPPGKTGLVISFLCDGELFRLAEQAGWLGELRKKTGDFMLDALEDSVYPGLRKKIFYLETATPVTLERMFHTSGGAITGWSLEERPPVPDNLTGIMTAVRTAVPGVFKAGQWSYSPSGVPVAILTGRIAAMAMEK